MAKSIKDYIFRRLALDYLPFEKRAGLGIYSAEERKRRLEAGSYEDTDVQLSHHDLTASERGHTEIKVPVACPAYAALRGRLRCQPGRLGEVR
jgi:ribonucleoside-diphosphate reductase alpha chain